MATKAQLLNRLIAAKDQAGKKSPTIKAQLEELIKEVGEVNENEDLDVNLAKVVGMWSEFTTKAAGDRDEGIDPTFIEALVDENPDKQRAFATYMSAYAIDFATVILSINSIWQQIMNESSEKTTEEGLIVDLELFKSFMSMATARSNHAKLFFQSLGINSPPQAHVALQKIKKMSLDFANKAGVRVAVTEIEANENLGDILRRLSGEGK